MAVIISGCIVEKKEKGKIEKKEKTVKKIKIGRFCAEMREHVMVDMVGGVRSGPVSFAIDTLSLVAASGPTIPSGGGGGSERIKQNYTTQGESRRWPAASEVFGISSSCGESSMRV